MQKIPVYEVGPVAASKTVVIRLEQLIGRRIHGLILEHGYASGTNTVAAAATNLSEIRLIANNVVKRRVSGTQLRDLLLLNGTIYDGQGVPNTAPGVALTMPFSEAWRQDRDQRDITAFPTRWGGGKNPLQQLGSLWLELDLGAASTPTVVVWAVVDDVVPDVANPAMIEWQPWSIPAGSTNFDYSIKQQGVLVALSLYPDSGGSRPCTRAKLVIDEVVKFDLEDSPNFADLIFNGVTPTASGRTASVFDIVLDRDDNLARAEALTQRTALLSIWATAGAMSGTITGVAQVLRGITL
jgi:hypothetical protein